MSIAVERLAALGALAPPEAGPGPQGERLTPLGCHVAQMPMDARLAKALIYACMLRCLRWGEVLRARSWPRCVR